MYGYIYLTTNLINDKKYIGKHKSEFYDDKYYGSGKILLQAISKYGIENFTNEILYEADCVEELNKKEKEYISLYREKYGKQMYNIASGGDGGDTYSSKSEEEKEDFVKKMMEINRDRCTSEEFKMKASERLTKKYSNIEERKLQSEKIKKAWNNEQLKKEQSERLKKYYKTHKKDNSYNNIPCGIKFNGTTYEFESVKQLKKFMKEEFNFVPRNPKIKQMMIDGTNGIPYISFFKKHSNLNGVLLYYKQNENVETMGDECSPVEYEIGTCSKCKTEIEEIVRPA